MTDLRAALTALVVALLVVGGVGAAHAAVGGDPHDWAVRMDAAPVRTLALVVLAFVPEKEPEA